MDGKEMMGRPAVTPTMGDSAFGGGGVADGALFCLLLNQPIRSVSFLKGGYVELSPKALSPESELLATFATKNSSGIILAALGRHGEKQRQAHGVSK